MTRQQLDKELQGLALRRANREDPEAINVAVNDLAARSGHSFVFLKSNVKMRADELRRKWAWEAVSNG